MKPRFLFFTNTGMATLLIQSEILWNLKYHTMDTRLADALKPLLSAFHAQSGISIML